MKIIGWILVILSAVTLLMGSAAILPGSFTISGEFRPLQIYVYGFFGWVALLLLGIFLVRKGRQREEEV